MLVVCILEPTRLNTTLNLVRKESTGCFTLQNDHIVIMIAFVSIFFPNYLVRVRIKFYHFAYSHCRAMKEPIV